MNLLPEERQIMEIKYASPCFATIPAEDRFLLAKTLLLKIHIITGWTIPNEEMMVILIDQFLKKMVESYPTINAEEMEYAFRNNPVKDWGKNMNLNLIDEVMSPYLQKRKELSRMEEEKASKLLTLPAPEITDDEFIDSIKNLYLDSNKNWRLIPVLAYDILVRQEKIKLDKEDKVLIKMIIDEQFEGAEEVIKKDLCKQYSVMNYFETK
jgi:hypothetical protein